MKTFITRTLTAAVFVVVLLGCILGGQVSFSILFLLLSLIGVSEFYKLVKMEGAEPNVFMGMLATIVLFTSFTFVHMDLIKPVLLYLNIPVIFSIFIFELYTKATFPFRNIGFTALALIYVALPFSLLHPLTLVEGEYSPRILIGVFFILWSNDTGAYLVGSLIGKNKMFERVSPGKTWEGVVGGVVVAFGMAWLISLYGDTSLTLVNWLVLAAILSVIGTLGDLVESLLKRSVAIKDSGSLLPGHGGVLDRFDSLIISAPFLFVYLEMIK